MKLPACLTASEQTSSVAAALSFSGLRRAVGIVACALPVVVFVGNWLVASHGGACLTSISESYYSALRDVFVGMLCAIGFFFMAYRGYNRCEDYLFNVAAVLAIAIALSAMNAYPPSGVMAHHTASAVARPQGRLSCDYETADHNNACVGGPVIDMTVNGRLATVHRTWMGAVHFISAAILLAFLGFVSACLFTRWDAAAGPTTQKLRRNRLYTVCGWVIWITLLAYGALMLVLTVSKSPMKDCLDAVPLLFGVETICLWAFALSWFVKGEGICRLND